MCNQGAPSAALQIWLPLPQFPCFLSLHLLLILHPHPLNKSTPTFNRFSLLLTSSSSFACCVAVLAFLLLLLLVLKLLAALSFSFCHTMDILPEPNAPEPSVHSCNSPQSGAQPAMLGRAWSQVHVAAIHAPSINQFACLRYLLTLHNLSAPIEPPHRHSSLAFSQFLQASDPAFSDAESLVTPQPTASHTPSRSLSNVGRKRALVSPLTRPAATPGHVSQMQRIFQDAKASLQLDAAIASSPAGSIASRLPGTGANKGLGHHRNNIGLIATDWRYSTVPQGLAEADLDVREPFPAESPGLPDHDFAASGRTEPVEREPMSSGFTSPVAAEEADVVMGNDASPTRGPTSSSSNNEKPTASPLATPVCGRVSARSMASTELEQPMRKMHVSHVDAWLNGVLHDSPNAQREQRRRSKSAKARDSTTHDVLDGDTHLEVGSQEIILSTPAKAAAQSAKLKRDLLGNGVRTFSNKEDVRPESHQASYALGCTTPTANLLRVPLYRSRHHPIFLIPLLLLVPFSQYSYRLFLRFEGSIPKAALFQS